MVGVDAAGDLAHVPHPRQVDGGAADSIGCRHPHESGFGLLGLLPETAWKFLCRCHRHNTGRRLCLALPPVAFKVLSAPRLYVCFYGCALSADWLLRLVGNAADGHPLVAFAASNADRSYHRFGGCHLVDSVLALVLL